MKCNFDKYYQLFSKCRNKGNFREINSGNIAQGILYRSNHPVRDRIQDSDIVLSAAYTRISTVINLADSEPSLRVKIVVCPWYKELYNNNNVITLDMNTDFTDKVFAHKLKRGIIFMIKHNPPYLIHCEAGIDRTGFVSVILEAFMGTKFEDMVKDYMLPFVDPSEYTLEDHKQGSIYIKNTFTKIADKFTKSEDGLQIIACTYLLNNVGLNDNEISLLMNKLRSSPYRQSPANGL